MKKLGKIALLIITSIVLFLLPAVVSIGLEDNQEIVIIIDEEQQNYDVSPILLNGRVLVPMRAIFEALGASVEWNSSQKTVNAYDDETSITVNVGSHFATVNGSSVQLDVRPAIIEGRTMIPLRFVSESFGANVEWESKTKTVKIKRKVGNSMDTGASHIEEGKTILTYEEAVKMAMDNSYELKNKKEAVKKAEELKNSIILTPGTYNPSLIQSKKGIDISLQWAEKQVEIAQENILYQVKNGMNDITILNKEIEYTDKKIENLKTKTNIVETKTKLGLESEYSLDVARKDFEQELKQKDLLSKSLDNAYIKLYKLLGTIEKEKRIPQDMLECKSLESINIEALVRKASYEDPYIWFQEKQIESAELGVRLYEYNIGSEPYAVKEINVVTAKNTLANMKLKLEESLRSRYNQAKQLEDNYSILKINYEKAEKGLKLLQVQYEVGMAIESQLKDAQVALEKIKLEMEKTVVQLEKLTTMLEKPYLGPDYVQ